MKKKEKISQYSEIDQHAFEQVGHWKNSNIMPEFLETKWKRKHNISKICGIGQKTELSRGVYSNQCSY